MSENKQIQENTNKNVDESEIYQQEDFKKEFDDLLKNLDETKIDGIVILIQIQTF